MGENTYEVSKSERYKEYRIWNTDRSELKMNPLEVNGMESEYIRTKINNEEESVKIVIEALGREKVEQLQATKEWISGMIYYRPDGKVISIAFVVQDNTILTLDDLVHIENTLKANYQAALESDPPNSHLGLYYIRLNYEWDFGKM